MNQPKKVKKLKKKKQQQQQSVTRTSTPKDQLGVVVRGTFIRPGMRDITRHRMVCLIGSTWVGNGVSGTLNSVYFITQSGTWIIQGRASGSSGMVAIAPSDRDVGQAYISDVQKHYARLRVNRMWIHVETLHPNTSNDMVAVFGIFRGPGAAASSIPITAATAAISSNLYGQVASMADSFRCFSWESCSKEITQFIAGGSGARQNEFDIQGYNPNSVAGLYVTSGSPPSIDATALVPACLAVGGSSTTVALQGSVVHQIYIEQEVDLLDNVAFMANNVPTQ